MSDREKCLSALAGAVAEFDVEACRTLSIQALALGIEPAVAVMDGLARGMEKVSVLFDTNQYFVPEVLLSAEALYNGLDILSPHVSKPAAMPRPTIVIGSVQGDVHDIGKNLTRLMFEVAGWEVHDLGCDVPHQAFVEKQAEVGADILAISAMMTTTMMGMKKIIAMVKSQRPECLIMLGGAPMTRDLAGFFGADGFAASAGHAVREGLAMMDRMKGVTHTPAAV